MLQPVMLCAICTFSLHWFLQSKSMIYFSIYFCHLWFISSVFYSFLYIGLSFLYVKFYTIVYFRFYHCDIVIDFMKSVKSIDPINIEIYFLLRFKINCFYSYLFSINGLKFILVYHMKTEFDFFPFECKQFTHWRRQWHPTPLLLPRKSHGWRSLVGCGL